MAFEFSLDGLDGDFDGDLHVPFVGDPQTSGGFFESRMPGMDRHEVGHWGHAPSQCDFEMHQIFVIGGARELGGDRFSIEGKESIGHGSQT